MLKRLVWRFKNGKRPYGKINKIAGFENKIAYQGPFTVKPEGKMAKRPLKYAGPGQNKIMKLDKVLDAVELKEGMTISFHHALRNGDLVMQKVIAAIAAKGIKNITLSASSLSLVQDALLPYLEDKTITAIDTSGARGKLGTFIQKISWTNQLFFAHMVAGQELLKAENCIST